jgi:hypothetical protein
MEEKIKKINPGQFKKKNLSAQVQDETTAKVAQEPESEEISITQIKEKKDIDMNGLVRDLMLNRYFHIMEKEARPIAEKMVSDGSASLHEVKWFLAHSERVQLAKELAEKYGIT